MISHIQGVKYFLLALLISYSNIFCFSIFSIDRNPYSLYTGEIASTVGARLSGMGGAGTALSDTLNYSIANPATLASVDYTILSVTYKPEITYLQEKSTSANSMNFSNDFPLAELVVPLGKYGVIFGGYKRDRLLNYDIRYTDDQGYLNHRFGSGGTYISQAGYALSLKKKLLFGISFGGLFGDTRLGDFIEQRPSGVSSLIPSTYQKASFYSTTLDVGVIYKMNKFSFGASGSFPLRKTETKRESQVIQKYISTDSIVTKLNWNGTTLDVVANGTLGAAWSPSRKTNFALDINGIRWDIPGRSNEYKIGIGMEHFFSEARNDNYFLNIPIRAGYYYHDLGLDDGILEQALTIGWSLPTANNYGILNFAVEGGRRYKESFSNSELTENFSKITIQFVHKGRWGRLRRAIGDF